jgi:hypothetical protein
MSFFGRLGNLARGAIRQSQLPDPPEAEPPPTPSRPLVAPVPRAETLPTVSPAATPADPTLPRKRTL